MTLPAGGNNVPWPPITSRTTLDVLAEWAAWYSGDPARLAEVYGGTNVTRTQIAVPWWKFWQRQRRQGFTFQARAQLHVPLAGDMAATSAALLFSEPPRISIPEAHTETAAASAKDQERFVQEKLIDEGGLFERLIEAADACAGIGGVFLKPSWDLDVASVPVLGIDQADQALPEFRFGILTAVTLWRTVREEKREIVRHLERHEVDPETKKGVVEHGLYKGGPGMLGDRVSDEQLLAMTGMEPRVELPFDGLGVRYVPNMRPNRRLRGTSLGASDYAESEGLLDGLDEVYASWVRDIRLAKGRIMVPEEFLDATGNFDLDHEVFSPLKMPSTTAQSVSDSMSINQFAIRVAEHEASALHFIERVVSRAGYSPQTFGLKIEGRAESGTALQLRENKTHMTQQRKGQWWRSSLADVTWMLQVLAQWLKVEGAGEPFRPRVELEDSVSENPKETAETIELLERAKAVSTEIKVRMAHPDWDDDQVKAEVARIKDESGLAVPPPGEEFPDDEEEEPGVEPTEETVEIDLPDGTTRTVRMRG